MICPHCKSNLKGGLIWETGLAFALEGKHYHQHGVPAASQEEAEAFADKYAQAYGATRTTGHWGREIGIYSLEEDRTTHYQCPDCGKDISRGETAQQSVP